MFCTFVIAPSEPPATAIVVWFYFETGLGSQGQLYDVTVVLSDKGKTTDSVDNVGQHC